MDPPGVCKVTPGKATHGVLLSVAYLRVASFFEALIEAEKAPHVVLIRLKVGPVCTKHGSRMGVTLYGKSFHQAKTDLYDNENSTANLRASQNYCTTKCRSTLFILYDTNTN